MGQFELENVNFFGFTKFFVKLISSKSFSRNFFVKLKNWPIFFWQLLKFKMAIVQPQKLHWSVLQKFVLRIYYIEAIMQYMFCGYINATKIHFRKISMIPKITKKVNNPESRVIIKTINSLLPYVEKLKINLLFSLTSV